MGCFDLLYCNLSHLVILHVIRGDPCLLKSAVLISTIHYCVAKNRTVVVIYILMGHAHHVVALYGFPNQTADLETSGVAELHFYISSRGRKLPVWIGYVTTVIAESYTHF